MFDLIKNGYAAWAGDLESLKEAQRLEALAISQMQAGWKGDTTLGGRADGEEVLPRMYKRKDNVGIVSIRGPLINTENEFTAWLGISTYPAIREAMVFAANDDEIDQILLDIESGGGQVSGVNDTAALIRDVNKLKTVTAFTGGMAASAAYWLGSSADKIHGDQLSITGSIGVILVHMDFSEMLKKDGIKPTILRIGQNKALGHPAEPLSDKAKAHMLDQMNAVYDVFTATVSKNRGLPLAQRDTWANGNEFMGEDAKKAGLLNSVSTYDKVFAQLVDNSGGFHNTQSQNNKRSLLKTPKASLSPEQLALIEAGAVSDQAAAAAAAALAAQPAAEVPAVPAVETPAAEVPAVAAPVVEKPATPAVVAPVAEVPKDSEVVAFLRAELATANAKVLELSVAAKASETKLADIATAHDALCVIAANSINKMAIALGGAESSLKALTATELVARHAAVSADFTKAFKTGGVASTAPAVEAKDTGNVIPMHRARIAAVGLQK